MPASWTEDARLLAVGHLADRNIQLRLHYGDPGNAGTSNQISGDGYAHATIARGGMTREGVTNARYSNTAAVDWAAASGDWGDGTDPQPVSWVSVWYDADAPAGSGYDTLLASFQIRSPQTVRNGDPFQIRARELDLIAVTS